MGAAALAPLLSMAPFAPGMMKGLKPDKLIPLLNKVQTDYSRIGCNHIIKFSFDEDFGMKNRHNKVILRFRTFSNKFCVPGFYYNRINMNEQEFIKLAFLEVVSKNYSTGSSDSSPDYLDDYTKLIQEDLQKTFKDIQLDVEVLNVEFNKLDDGIIMKQTEQMKQTEEGV
jgi:hypothetical protein